MGDLATIEETTLADWERTIAIDQTGVFLGMKTAAPPRSRHSGHGSVINISSIFGTSGGFGTSPAYHAAKGAVRTLTKNVALHWATEGRPGQLDPSGLHRHPDPRRRHGAPRSGTTMTDLTPMGRLGEPDEIAAGGRLPRERRRVLRHRARALHRRRLHGSLTPTGAVRSSTQCRLT